MICFKSFSQKQSVFQNDKFPFQHIQHFGTEHGLSGSEIMGITQDNNGFMWFLTDNGLSRFDGYNFRSFAYDISDPNSPPLDYFTMLIADIHNNIWISGKSTGVYRFDMTREVFTNYNYRLGKNSLLMEGPVMSVAAKNDGTVWFAVSKDLSMYDPHTKGFTHFPWRQSDSLSITNSIGKELLFDMENTSRSPDELWIVNNSGVIDLFNTKTRQVVKRFQSPHSNPAWDGFYILGIRNNRIWVGSDGAGIYGFDTNKEKFLKVAINGNYKCKRNHGFHPALEDHAGNIWTSNDNNEIVFYERRTAKTYFYRTKRIIPDFITHWPTFFEDRSHKIWVGTMDGLIAIDNKRNPIVSLSNDDRDPSSVSSDVIFGINGDKDGRIYVGAKTIDVLNRSTNTFSQLRFYENGKELDMWRTWSIYKDTKGVIWFTGAVSESIVSYDPGSKKYKIHHLYSDSGQLTGGYLGIRESDDGKYWAVNIGKQVCLFDPTTDKTIVYPIHPLTMTSGENESVTLFLSSKKILFTTLYNGGLVTFDTQKKIFKTYRHDPLDIHSLSQETATTMIEKNGLIWIFTLGGGITVFNPAIEKFRTFTTADGLAHNIGSGIVEDKNGDFWVSTRGGLSRFKPPDDPFSPDARLNCRNYDVRDGLPSNVMNMLSCFVDDDGTLFFGTRNGGLFYFHPDSLEDNPYKPPVFITEFRLLNKPVSVQDSNSLLKSAIEYTKEIKLNYRKNTISFSFTALNFIHPEKNKFKYKLENYDEDWISTDATKRFANYTNLPPGNYIFKVKASNDDDNWNEEPTELKIIITPPFWQRLWFKILVAFTLAGILYSFYRYRIGQILLLQRIRNKIAADLHDDIGSTLNSISVYSEVAKKDDARKDFALTMIGESSRRIIESMSDIVWSINPENDSFDKLIFRMRSLAFNITKAKNIDCTFKVDESLTAVKLPMHIRRNVYLIYKEALNNLVKYSHAIKASVVLMHENRQVVMIVRDDGIGFDVNAKHNGNGLSNIKRRAGEINAKVNIDSSTGAGTTIELNLKV